MQLLTMIFQRGLIVVVSVAVAVVGLELGFRWVKWHRLTPPELEDAPVYHHRLNPRRVFHQTSPDFQTIATTNNLGLRGPRDYGARPSGTRRILMLGDSFTFGVGVNDAETFCALLQQAFDEQGAGIEVINAGLGGYSPILHYLALQGLYLDLEPDLVMLWFDFGDLQDDFFYERNLRYDEQGHFIGCDPNYVHGRFQWFEYLVDRSAFLRYVNSKLLGTYRKIRILGLRRYLQAKLRGERAKAAIAKLKGAQRAGVEPLNYDQLLMIRDRANLPEIHTHWQRTGHYLLLIRELLRERGIPFVLAAYPYGIQVGPDQWARGRTAFGFEPGVTYDDPFAFEFLEAFAKAHEIRFVNTYGAFREARDKRLFHDWDGHFTAAGHRVIAEYLLRDSSFLTLLSQVSASGRGVAVKQDPSGVGEGPS